MKQLYIIGNGFDIHHGIPSQYSNYCKWLGENDANLIERLRNFYNVDDKKWWSQFELELGYPDMSEYIEEVAFENQPDYGSDSFRDRDYHAGQIAAEDEIGALITDIKGTFKDWISSLPSPIDDKKIKIDRNDAFFINFNYTNTLQKVYNIKPTDILFIHGNATNDKDLVLGHNRSYDEINAEFSPELPEPPEDLEDNELAEWYDENFDCGEDYIHQSVRDEVVSQICRLRKDTQNIIKANQISFEALKNTEIIHIYGLSFSPVDMPYLDEIANKVDLSTVKWNVSYYSDEDKKQAQHYFNKKGINDILVKYIKLVDLLLIKQAEFQFERNKK